MTLPPPPWAPFPSIGGHSLDPSVDPADAWYESLQRRLFRERVVPITGFVDHECVNQAAPMLMTLDAEGDEAVKIHVDCDGGTLDAALALVDMIDAMGVEVHAFCLGQVVGPPLAVVAVAQRRIGLEHSRFALREPVLELSGSSRDITAGLEHQRERLQRFRERLAEATGRSIPEIERDLRLGKYLDAEGARSYGIIDEIAHPEARIIALPRQFGFRRS